MDLTLEEIRDKISENNNDELLALLELLEDVSKDIRKVLNTRAVACDTSMTFKNNIYQMHIGDITLSGQTAHFTAYFSKKALPCKWGERCKQLPKCEYYHENPKERRILRYGDSPLIKRFLSCEPEHLGKFYRANPRMQQEIVNFKDRLLDGVIRLLWLSSEGIKLS